VERNTVVSITIRQQVKSYPRQKIITMIYAVGMKKDSKKPSIAEEGAQATVPNGGRFALLFELTVLRDPVGDAGGDAGRGASLAI